MGNEHRRQIHVVSRVTVIISRTGVPMLDWCGAGG